MGASLPSTPWAVRGRLPKEYWTGARITCWRSRRNQGRLYQDVRDLFEGAEELGWDGVPYDYATTLNKDTGGLNGGNAGPSATRPAWDT